MREGGIYHPEFFLMVVLCLGIASSDCVVDKCDWEDCNGTCCMRGEVCYNGSCCVPNPPPETCPTDACGIWDDGCGGDKMDCGQCTGETKYCSSSSNGRCEDDCAYMECGVSPELGLDCGSCGPWKRCLEDFQCGGTRLQAPDRQGDDLFGNSVSISGDYAIVGAFQESGGDGDPFYRAGAAYIFHREHDEDWQFATKIMAPDPRQEMNFGTELSISGDCAIVREAKAYLFCRDGNNTWQHEYTSATSVRAVDVDGRYAIEGAYSDGLGFFANVLFRGQDDVWVIGAELAIPNTPRICDVAIQGNYAIVGTCEMDIGEVDVIQHAGAAYIYRRTGENSWDEGTLIVAPDAKVGDYFGRVVSIFGDYAIVGSMETNRAEGGIAYIFHRIGDNVWDEGYKLVAPDVEDDERFGIAVDIGDGFAAVGADERTQGYREAINIFELTATNTWEFTDKVDHWYSSFGESLAIDGERIIVGAPHEKGFAYIFKRQY